MSKSTIASLCLAAAILATVPAYAQNQGDACSIADKVFRVETPANSGLICDGSLLQYYLTARTTPTRLGIATGNTPNAGATLHVGGTNSILITSGTTAQRPGTPVNGMIRYNTTTGKFEAYQAGAWTDMIGGGGSIDSLSDAATDYTTDHNMFMGQNAGLSIASGGINNLFIGENAGDSITVGDNNVAIGYGALEDAVDSTENVAIGRWAAGGLFDVADYRNTAIGYLALGSALGGYQNTAIGAYALRYSDASAGDPTDNTMIGYSAGVGAVTFSGRWNTFIGSDAVSQQTATSADNNVFVGQGTGAALTSGDNNTVLGVNSGNSLSTGSNNIILGYNLAVPSATGSNQLNIGNTIFGEISAKNIRIGGSGAVTAGPLIASAPTAETIAAAATITANACGTIKQITATADRTTNTTNTFTAPAAGNAGCCMDVINTGTFNITLDYNANFETASGSDVVLGEKDSVRVCTNGTTWFQGEDKVAGGGGALDNLSDAKTDYVTDFNLFIGTPADSWAIAAGAQYNLAIGQNAFSLGTKSSSTDYNTAVGFDALRDNSGGWANTALGHGALRANTTGGANTALSSGALISNTTGSQNVAIGEHSGLAALQNNTTGDQNVAVGGGALGSNVGKNGGVAVGFLAMYYANSAAASGFTYNTAVGYEALKGSTTASANTGIGNTAIGFSALTANTSGSDNAAIGGGTLLANTVGSGNVAIGDESMTTNVGGSQATAVGFESMRYANSASGAFATYNTALGYQALRGSTTASANTGTANTAIGHSALLSVTSGSGNVSIGDRASDNITSGSNNITIGSNIDVASATASDQLNIGGTIYGDLSTDKVTIGTTAGQIQALPPAAETIAAAATITANACGTIKQITATAARTTNTTNTFTAPAAGNAGCCMDVINTGTFNITLDANTAFKTIGGADQVIGQDDAVRVCSNGSNWYQLGAVSANQ